MAAASPILCTITGVASLAAVDKRTSPWFQFRLRSNGTQNQKVSSRSRGFSIIRCEEENNRVAVESGDGWIAENDGLVRGLPLVLGAGALVAILLNRSFAGIAPVTDSSSAQSRSDVLALALAATVLLQGLVWKSIQPRPVLSVEMDGVDCFNMVPSLSGDAAWELKWVWDSLRNATRTKALVILYDGACVLQAGLSATAVGGNAVPVNASEFMSGELYKGGQKSGRQTYLANLALYPGRFELLRFIPPNTQAVLLQPLGDDGILVLASDTIRGFTPADQEQLQRKLTLHFKSGSLLQLQKWRVNLFSSQFSGAFHRWPGSGGVVAVCSTYFQQPSFLCKEKRGDGVRIEPRHAGFTFCIMFVKGGVSYPVGFSSLVFVKKHVDNAPALFTVQFCFGIKLMQQTSP